jgi:two-component system, NarL family, response regulator
MEPGPLPKHTHPPDLTKSHEDSHKITVLVVDDHPLIREGLTQILNGANDISVVGQAADGNEACAMYKQLLPQVMILDLRLPKMPGIQVLRELGSLGHRRPRVIIMTSFDSDHAVCQAVRAGAKAFLQKMADPQQIREAVRRVARGESFFPPDIGVRLLESMSKPQLSPREIEVLEQLANGKSNREIGTALSITEATVKHHVKSILKKLDAVCRAEAISIALKRGWLQVNGLAELAFTTQYIKITEDTKNGRFLQKAST